MTTRISPNDWEILSAYLDGQVSAKEQEKLKQKLAAEPELQRALEELQRTKMVLRSAPRRRVPHNFTLTPAMIPQRKPWFRLVPTLSFASAMAVILLVLTFTFSSLSYLAKPGSLAAQAPQATQAAGRANLAAPQTELTQPGTTNPPIINWGGYGMGGGGGGGSGGADPTLEAQMATENALANKGGDTSIAPTTEPGIGGGPTTEPPVGGNEPVKPELTPTPEGTSQPSIAPQPTETTVAPGFVPLPTQPSSAQATLAPGEGPILGIRPTQEMGKIVVDQGVDQYTPPAPTANQAAPQSFLSQHIVAIQVGLGVLALAMALAAFLIHRRS
jgi:negative regulator of sigma E activity